MQINSNDAMFDFTNNTITGNTGPGIFTIVSPVVNEPGGPPEPDAHLRIKVLFRACRNHFAASSSSGGTPWPLLYRTPRLCCASATVSSAKGSVRATAIGM
jgi:hypothetical protein